MAIGAVWMEVPAQVSSERISLVGASADKRSGCGACGKGRNGGKRDCLLGRYEASGGGVWHSRLAKEGGLNEEDNWLRLQ
eukprot:scaffold380731_cov59-Attheya_sp.AAC.1